MHNQYSSCALHAQPTGKTVKPLGCCAFIKRGDAQGLQVAPQFMDILRGDDNAAGHDAGVQVRRWEYDGVRESPSKVVYEDGSET
nr:hypothetical protein [Pectobacterium odoriferum]